MILTFEFIFRCQLEIREGGNNSDETPVLPETITDFTQLLKRGQDASSDSSRFTDVVLKVGESEFHCHKAIISQRSTTFKELFLAYVSA